MAEEENTVTITESLELPDTLQVSLDSFKANNCETPRQALALCLLLADENMTEKAFQTRIRGRLLKKMLLSEEALTANDVLGGLENELLLEIFNDQLFPNVRAFIPQ